MTNTSASARSSRESRQDAAINLTLVVGGVAVFLGVLYGLVRFVKWAWR